jgi:hypothetical protein
MREDVRQGVRRAAVTVAVALAAAFVSCIAPGRSGTNRYDDLVALFGEWREFQAPRRLSGVPDYTPAATAAQQRALASYRQRLEAIDPRSWPVPQQVDWHIVRAEMNGLDFDHRVLRPWASDPGFYVTVFPEQSDQPAREGPHAWGAVELWQHPLPLSPESVATIDEGLRRVPALLKQARGNLVGHGRDLWYYGTRAVREQSRDLGTFAERLGESAPALHSSIAEARTATDAFADWLDAQAPTKTGPSGIGIAHYDWYLRHVHLVPYTWQDELTLVQREAARAEASLALEEHRNRALPQQIPVSSAEEHAARFSDAVTNYMAFLKDREMLTVRAFMEPALRARLGRFRPGPREFFTEVDYRDPMAMRTHGFHWFDLAWMAHLPHPSPIRRGALLYNAFDTRTEGLATGWEELTLQAGMFDARPRSRELIYILIAQRAARAQGDLRMHANEATLEEAARFAAETTPRGWLRLDGTTVRAEQHLYLQQPSYGTSYLIGKLQIDALIAARRRQLGDAFTVAGFMDDFQATGLIPMSLISWELTGERPAFLDDATGR